MHMTTSNSSKPWVIECGELDWKCTFTTGFAGRAPEVQQFMSITTIFRDACLFAYSPSMLLSKTEDHGTLVQDQLNSTQNSSRVAPEVQKLWHTVNKTCIQSKDVPTCHTLGIV